MNIKALLIGSAAALAVVSGAQAADAVVAAEPEPMEYVRVCDAYGTGFFYIPGTETCLKIGGQLRYEKVWDKWSGLKAGYYNHTRARLELTAKNDSEWGTVSSWMRLEYDDWDNIHSGSRAFFTFGLGGLEFSNFESQWVRFLDYHGRTDWGGDYGYQMRQQISYTASFDSVSAIISLEHDRNTALLDPATGLTLNPADNDSKYMPDVVVGAKATFGDWTVYGAGAWDESDESFAVVKKVSGNLGMFGVGLEVLYSDSATNSYFSYDGWSVLASASASVTDSVSVAADVQFWDDNSYAVIGDVAWNVATGFDVLLEGYYKDYDNGPTYKYGMLRFQRSF